MKNKTGKCVAGVKSAIRIGVDCACVWIHHHQLFQFQEEDCCVWQENQRQCWMFEDREHIEGTYRVQA